MSMPGPIYHSECYGFGTLECECCLDSCYFGHPAIECLGCSHCDMRFEDEDSDMEDEDW